MDKTKIDWADASWNPVTGCLHGCAYCYARKIAERFRGCCLDLVGDSFVVRDGCGKGPIYELNNPVSKVDGIDPVLGSKVSKAPYPFSFSPTFHRYRLDIPAHWTKPRTIFVCSMADLFGDWVPGLKRIELPDWIIVGAETGNRKNKVRPGKDWLGGIVNGCAEHNIPLFMKESLRNLMGSDFRQEFPWEG